MGIRDTLRQIWSAKASRPTTRRTRRSIRSPWQAGQLSSLMVSEILGGQEAQFLTREQAITIPPVYKGRAILVSQIAPAPLIAMEGTAEVAGPNWLQHTPGAVSPWHRMAWTVDDIMFSGWSLWGTPRNAAGEIETAERIPIEWWNFDADGNVIVNEEMIDDERDVILFPGPSEGFLEYATRSMRGATALEEAYVNRAKHPVPVMELRESVNTGMTDDELDDLLDDMIAAREDPKGLLTMTPYGFELHVHGEQARFDIEGRNFAKIDVASFLNLPASALDASLSTASLTYSTQEGKRNEIADYSVSYWADPIAARLSQDDVVPEGQRVRFDFGDLRTPNPSPTGPTSKD